MKNKWILSPHAFDRFLLWLSADKDEAGRKYEEMRQKLILFFTKRGCPEPEELTDSTLDRGARKLERGELNYSGDPIRDIKGFAKYVWMEDLRKLRPEPLENFPFLPYIDMPDRETLFKCMERCVASLTEHSRSIVIRYHHDEGSEKIRIRQSIADEEGIEMQTLRTRIFRILKPVRKCFFACIEKETGN